MARSGLDAALPYEIVVVGAGISGLTAAYALAPMGPVRVVDRLPVPGGLVAGPDDPAIREAARAAISRDVVLELGTTALRWAATEQRLLVASPRAGFRWLPCRHLVYAGGRRPATAAELRLLGDRLAGVLPATVAFHLLEAGVRLGYRVAIVGGGGWAQRVADLVARQGSMTIIIEPNAVSSPAFGDAVWAGWSPTRTCGSGRVSELHIVRDGACERIVCDAVVLAASWRPLRNVDGAVFDDDPGVTYVQVAAESSTLDARVMYARERCAVLRTCLSGVST